MERADGSEPSGFRTPTNPSADFSGYAISDSAVRSDGPTHFPIEAVERRIVVRSAIVAATYRDVIIKANPECGIKGDVDAPKNGKSPYRLDFSSQEDEPQPQLRGRLLPSRTLRKKIPGCEMPLLLRSMADRLLQPSSVAVSNSLSRLRLVGTPIYCTFADKKVGLAASRLPDRRIDRRPVQPIYRYRPASRSRQLNLNMLATSGALEVKPFLVTLANLSKDKALREFVRRFSYILCQELGTTKKSDIN